MSKPLLIEITTEELPAIPFLKQLKNIETIWLDILKKYSFETEFKFFYTPRRITLWHREFLEKQPSKDVKLFGPPVSIAFKDNMPTKAAIAFANKCGVEVDKLSRVKQPKGEVLYYESIEDGKSAKELLPDMIKEFISTLHFGKSMRWASFKESFIRPIKNLVVVLGDELIEAEIFNIKSKKAIYPHRMVGYDLIDFNNANEYFCKITSAGIILDQEERKTKILRDFEIIEKKHNIKIEIDKELLDEVVAITEYPTALIGKFDEKFLQLPKEIIITSMKEHQRYFAVYKDDKLTNNFIVVSNAKTNDFSLIIKGNEKVLRPRLEDAMFFYKNDLAKEFSSKGLENINFVDNISVADKIKQEEKIALLLAEKYNLDKNLIKRAVELSKADLLSEVVYEFTELQGIMGYYYAKAKGEDELVAISIKEQYLPKDEVYPTNIFSAVIAISNKLDTIITLFKLNKIPTGNKDPYGLRRAANGIINIVLKFDLDFDYKEILKELDSYDKKIVEFIEDRFVKIFKVNKSVLKAVLNTNSNIKEIYKKSKQLDEIISKNDFKDIKNTFKRVANIISNNFSDDVDTTLFEYRAEEELYNKFLEIDKNNIEELFSLKPFLDRFFDEVYINDKRDNIRQNRKNLVTLIYKGFLNIADIKEISK